LNEELELQLQPEEVLAVRRDEERSPVGERGWGGEV